ncbi:MAG: UvrD-helicase domain-containing protein [Armatimonadota bacterium]
MNQEPIDASERRQSVDFPLASRFVEAGAGTGKTTTMVRRMLASLGEDVTLDRQVAVTFTVKAAHEITDRLRTGLEKEPHLHSHLADLSRMRVGTIDSVVQGILDEFGVDADLAGGFRILGEAEFEDRFGPWFDRAYRAWNVRDDLQSAWGILESLELDLSARRRYLMELARRVFDQAAPLRVADGPSVSKMVAQWRANSLPELETPVRKDLDYPRKLESAVGQLRRSADRIASGDLTFVFPKATLGNAGGLSAKPQRDALNEASEALEGVLETVRFGAVVPLVRAVIDDANAFVQELRREGKLTFQHALHAATQMLRGNAKVLETVRAGIGAVYVDEFQDTSPDQVEFVNLLSNDGAIPLFLVGDPKQSIYRFRGADVEGYLRERDRGDRRGVPTGSLVANFRSVAPVLDEVNAVFAGLFGAEDGPGYAPLVAHADPCGIDAQVHVVRDLDGVGEGGGSARVAGYVVRGIRRALATRWQVRDGGRSRDIRPSDIAVLYPSRTVLPELRRQLTAAGIPHRVEGATEVLDTDEVRAVVAVLRAAASIGAESSSLRRTARGGALASLSFGCAPWELADGIAADVPSKPEGDASSGGEAGPATEESPLRLLMKAIRFEPPSRAVSIVIRERALLGLAGGHDRPRAVVNRLRGLMDRAMAAERDGVVKLSDFVAWLESSPEWTESPSPETDEDSVRLMTVHASKGLEFPMVVVAGFGGKAQPFTGGCLVNDDGVVRVRWNGSDDRRVASPGWDDSTRNEREAAERERERLLYVAMTRARDHLLVGVHGAKVAKNGSAPALILKLLERSKLEEEPDNDGALAWTRPETPWKPRDVADLRNRWVLVEKNDRRTTPTRLAKRVDPEVEDDGREDEPDPESAFVPSPAARSSTAFGLAVHLALQTIDPDAKRWGDSAAAAARAAAARHGAEEDQVLRYVQRALKSQALFEAGMSRRVEREVYAAAPSRRDPDCLLEGIVDLVYERADGTLAVVDYKTDKVDNPRAARRKMETGYVRQGLAYRDLLEDAVGARVGSVTFVFLGLDSAPEFDALEIARELGIEGAG